MGTTHRKINKVKSLKNILTGIKTNTNYPAEMGIEAIVFDSRKVTPGCMFVAVSGTISDGHDYLNVAIEKGAKVIVCERLPENTTTDIVFIKVENSAEALGIMASNFHGNPSAKLRLVAVTGTNGKTSTATLLHRLFLALGYQSGLLSTVENRIGNEVIPSTHTTPDALALNQLLARMVELGCGYAFIEASSHAIDQRRIAGLQFAGAIFTNITHDHLDYHKTFANYIDAKKRLFDDLPKDAFALVNIDDKRGEVMLQNTAAAKRTFALKRPADFKAKILDNALSGLQMIVNDTEFHARLVGDFNAYNLLGVYGAAILLGQDKTEVLTAMSNLTSAEGRFDYVIDTQRDITAIVDYAHTPDALEKVLDTIAKLRKGNEQVITIVGCGGDRDKTKRPEMAKIAARMSDTAILTSDNPRTENPEDILRDMEAGITPDLARKVLKITDRREAIKTAYRLAKNGDIILIAGKGHEKYQEINGVKHHFDDKEIIVQLIDS